MNEDGTSISGVEVGHLDLEWAALVSIAKTTKVIEIKWI